MKRSKECRKCGSDSWISNGRPLPSGKLRYRCVPCRDVYKTHHYQSNKVKIDSINKQWAEDNPDRHNKIKKRWRDNNPGTKAKYKAAKKQAIPSWADQEIIRDFYLEAQYHQMELDHIIPLQSNNVCGLHWEGNMQLLTKSENASKGNRYWPDMWES